MRCAPSGSNSARSSASRSKSTRPLAGLSPKPRRSTSKSRYESASGRCSRQVSSPQPKLPWTKTTGSPSPQTVTFSPVACCTRRAYNSGGRCYLVRLVRRIRSARHVRLEQRGAPAEGGEERVHDRGRELRRAAASDLGRRLVDSQRLPVG